MTNIPIFCPQIKLPRYVPLKKAVVKGLTFAVFPKKLRHRLKKHLNYKFGIGEKPYNAKNRQRMEQVQAAFFAATAEIDRRRYQIISVGSDCMSRTLPTFWGLKPRKKDGEKSFPFDLSANNITGMVQNLQNDFADFFEGIEWSKTFNCYLNVRQGSYYLHEKDLTDTPESLTLFRQRFERRIADFRAALQAELPVIFVFHYGEQLCCSRPEEFDSLYAVVKKLRGNRPTSWLVVDTSRSLKPEYSDVEYYIPDFLPGGYVWHTDSWRYTPEGIRFESEMMEKLLKLIRQYQL